MGRVGNRKPKKSDRLKAKAIATKTLLPKGQNVTDTNFKVKKIVIRDQVHAHKEDEILSKKQLSCKDLLVRLNHHNVSMKHEAVLGLKELITDFPKEIIEANLSRLIESISKLMLDETHDIRKGGCKLLSMILSKVPLSQLIPFFPSLSSYLICGLTHINSAIREDSLLLLDTLLKHTPDLCISAVPKLLPICLDLVSSGGDSGSRMLSVNLESKLSSSRWRLQVLQRIATLLKIVFDSSEADNTGSRNLKTLMYKISTDCPTENGKIYIPLNLSQMNLDFSQSDKFSKEMESYNFKEFSETLIPLLLEMFVELVPIEKKSFLKGSNTETILTFEAELLLRYICTIMSLIWEVSSPDLKKWLINKFGNQMKNSLIECRFPYSVKAYEEEMKKFKSFLPVADGDNKKMRKDNINLLLAKLIITFNRLVNCDEIIHYITNYMRGHNRLSSEELSVLISCFDQIGGPKFEENDLFLSTFEKLSNSSNNIVSSLAVRALYSYAVNIKNAFLLNNPRFLVWIESLPEKLSKPQVTSETIDIICDIARRNFEVFSKSLDSYIEVILDNLPNLNISNAGPSEENEAKLKVAQLLYWVQDWDKEMVEELQKAIANNYWGLYVTKQITDILELKQDSFMYLFIIIHPHSSYLPSCRPSAVYSSSVYMG